MDKLSYSGQDVRNILYEREPTINNLWMYVRSENFTNIVLKIFNSNRISISEYFNLKQFIEDSKFFLFNYFMVRLRINGISEYHHYIDNRSEIKCKKLYTNLIYPNNIGKNKPVTNEETFFMFDVLREINKHLLAYYINLFNIFPFDIANNISNISFVSY